MSEELKVHFCTSAAPEFEADEIGYDLLNPCSDCPFTKDAPLHRGVMQEIPNYMNCMEMGKFAHTCHKTDDRTDCNKTSLIKGKVQHCVGAILFCEKNKQSQDHYIIAHMKKKFNLYRLRGMERIYSARELLMTYKPFAENELKKSKETCRPSDAEMSSAHSK